MLPCCKWKHPKQASATFESRYRHCFCWTFAWKSRMQNVGHFVQPSICLLIEAEWRIYASVNKPPLLVMADNGLAPDRRQAIIWTNAGILLMAPLGTNFSEILIEIGPIFIQENAFENVVCAMSAILSRSQYVDTIKTCGHCHYPAIACHLFDLNLCGSYFQNNVIMLWVVRWVLEISLKPTTNVHCVYITRTNLWLYAFCIGWGDNVITLGACHRMIHRNMMTMMITIRQK